MRKYICIIGVLVFVCAGSAGTWAQNFSWGIKGGVNIGTPYGKAEEGATGSLGIGPRIGAFVNRKFNEKVDLQVGAFHSFKGGKYETPVSGDTIYEQELNGTIYLIPTFYKGWVEGEFGNVYIDFPLLARYKTGKNFYLLAGPQISYLVKGQNSGTADIEIGVNYSKVYDEPFDEGSEINNWDYSLVLAGNYESNSGINVDMGLSFGIRSLFKSSYDLVEGMYRNIYLYTVIGYRFGKENPSPKGF